MHSPETKMHHKKFDQLADMTFMVIPKHNLKGCAFLYIVGPASPSFLKNSVSYSVIYNKLCIPGLHYGTYNINLFDTPKLGGDMLNTPLGIS